MTPKRVSIEFSLSTLMQLIAIAGLIVSGTVAVENIRYEVDNLQKEDRRLAAQQNRQEKNIQLLTGILLEQEKNEENRGGHKNEQV